MPIRHSNAALQPLPSDLQAIFDELNRTDEEARRLVASLSEAQLNWQPGGGAGWSVGQCLDHLAQSNTLYTSALRDAVRGADPAKMPRRGPIRPGWFSRWFIAQLEPPIRRKIKAQKKVTPAQLRSGAELLKAFRAAHDQTRAVVEASRDLDLNRVRFTNPFIRLFHFTVGTGLLVIGAHDRRHLLQARNVFAAMQREQP